MEEKNHDKKADIGTGAMYIISMLIFGSVGIFKKYIVYSSSVVALCRSLIGGVFILLIALASKRKPDIKEIKKNILPLALSGACLGINWVFLFEAYNYTTVAVATLCYYLAPAIVVLTSPLFFKERLGAKKLLCVFFSLLGMLLISGVLNDTEKSGRLTGVLLGLLAAVFYAGLIIFNKKLKDVSSSSKSVTQLLTSSVVLLPYVLFTASDSKPVFDTKSIILLVIVGIVHTGVAYTLYFASVGRIKTQTAAICGYIDPICAVLLSALILGEGLDLFTALGMLLILVSAYLCEK